MSFKIRLCMFILGLLIISVGLSLTIIANIGISPWDALTVGLSEKINVSVGVSMNIIAVFSLIASAVIAKKKPNFLCLITSLILGVFSDLNLFLLRKFEVATTFESVIIFIIGLLLITLGVAFYLKTKFPLNYVDNLMLILISEKNFSTKKAKLITECVGFFLALLLGGPVTITTIVVCFVSGNLVQMFEEIIETFIKRNISCQ